MNATILDPELYERAKSIVYQQYKKPSAYRSGALVQKYKELGGRYGQAVPKSKTALDRWYKEEWKDIGGQAYPVFRPTKRINAQTPLTASEIDSAHAKKQIARKQRIKGTQNLPPFERKK